jgi:hypothetical protein
MAKCHHHGQRNRLSTALICDESVVKFVRPKKTGRLCPLCKVHLDQFELAIRTLPDASKQRIVGDESSYEIVALDVGADEFTKQTT